MRKNCTSCFSKWRLTALLLPMVIGFNVNPSFGQGKVVTVPPVNGTTTWGAITFNLSTTQMIRIDTLYVNTSGTTGTVNLEVWYRSTPITAQPLTSEFGGTNPVWTNIITTQAVPAGTDLAPIIIPGGFLMPANAHYGFYIGDPGFSNAGIRYGSAATTTSFTDGTITVTTGTNISYGWVRNGTTTNHPRYFAGGVRYSPGQKGLNNAGINKLTAPNNFCAGVHTVKVEVTNAGSNKLDSVRVNWTVDGTPRNTVYVTTPLDTTGGLGNSTLEVSLGTINFTNQTAKQLKIWTSHPNGAADTSNDNDTLEIALKPSLNGVFTIGGISPDYSSFSAAAADLNSYGVCGPVTFIVRPGTYVERVILKEISGSSATNMISFIGSGKSTTIITHAGSSTGDWSTVLLDGSDYIRFRDMTIRGTDVTFGIGIHLINKADNNNFDNIRVQMNNGSTGGNTAGIALSTATSTTGASDAGNNNTFDSLDVTGAYYGFTATGATTTTDHSQGNKVLNSRFTNQYYYGIRFYSQDYPVADNNIIKDFRNTLAYGMYLYYCSDYTFTNNNIISPYYGMYQYFGDRNLASGNKNSLIANNMILGGTIYSFYSSGSYDIQFYHNTVVNDVYANNAYYTGCNNMDIRNNIFINRSTTTTGYAIYITGGSVDNLDYNTYYSHGTSFVYHTAARASMAAWRTAFPAFNANSTVADVRFIASDNLHVKSGGPNYPGTNLGISKDIDGNPRSVTSPTCGADEKVRVPNNAGVNKITSPQNFCIGTHDLKVEIENAGINRIDSVRVYWSSNGVIQTPVYVSTVLDTFGGTGSTTLEVTLGTLNFSGSGKTIKVWTSHPNGVVDTVNGNDTINVLLKSSLSGVFTIGGTTPDFNNFEELIDDLNAFGVCGPVTVYVRPGTYNERVTLGEISGTSSTNTVSFMGSGVGSTIITNAGTSTANWSTVLLDGSDHVHFRDMTIRGTDITNGIGIHLINKADSNSFRNIHVQMNNGSTSGNTAGVAITTATSTTGASDAGNYNTFDSLNVTGAYYGIVAYGPGTTTAHCFGNKLLNSTFSNQYYYGIRFNHQNDMVIENNSVTGFRNTTAYGMYIYYCSDYMIGNNYVVSPYYGTYLYYGDRALSSGNKNSTVYNNIIQGGTLYSFYSTNTDDLQFYHNTITGDGRYANNAYFTGCNNLDIRNNIFINPNTGATSHALYITGGSVDDLDYNVYHSLGTTLIYHGAIYNNYAAYRAALPLFNEHSLNIDPQLSADMHLTSLSPEMPGTYLNIDVDIDGDPRCDLQAAIGADEPVYSMINPMAGFALPDTLFVNSPARFINTSTAIFGEPLGYAWYMDGVATSTDKDIIYTFNATGTYELMLKTRNCAGYDSFSVSVQVVTPQSVPESDFTASQLVANTLPTPDIIQLFDMSLHGATAWNWTITPSLGVIFDPNEANPTVQFSEPGYYDVCLTAENMHGVGTTHCKTAYIYVNEEHWMGGPASSSNMSGGRISDDGWVADYGANAYASFLIEPDPCAGEINLKFSFFDLADNGDVLSVYDGEDQNGLLIGNYTVGDFPGGNAGLTAYSGKMFLLWTTDGDGVANGWQATWSAKPHTGTTPPVADFTYNSTVFTANQATFTATADKVSYLWDFAPPALTPGINGGKGKTDKYTWNTQGVYDVKLQVKNCAGTDSITKQITVMDPVSIPVVGFYADQLRVPAHTTVNFFDTSDQGPTAWLWSVNPSGMASFETAKTVKNPSITFYAPGNYEIKLVAENSLGKDSLIKTAYIQVFDYCIPAVGTLNGDIGISRVQFAGIDNSSAIGQTGHTKYIKNFAAQKLYQRAQYTITIERNTAFDSMSRKAWIDFNGDGDFTDAGEMIAFEPAAKTLSYTASFTIPVGSFTGLSVLRVGTSYAQGNNSPCGINPMGEFEDYPIEIAIDDIIPVITLIGADTVYTEQWYQYTDAGATALDELDGDITSQIVISGTVDSSMVGTYILSYNVSDMATNMAQPVTRTVIVTPDVTAPVITLIGNNPVIHTIATPYNDAGATALDYFNRDITVNLMNGNNVDINTFGTYYFWYTVTDANGNTDSVARVVEIVDNIKPVLTLIGDTLKMEVYGDITDPGFIVTDNHYVGVDVVIDSSNVKKHITGIYSLLYTATDSSGNISTAVRLVKVQDTQLPVITIINDEIDIEVHTSYVEPGVITTDNYCVTQAAQSVSTIDTAELGVYTVTYTVTDCEGNISLPAVRTVNVVDRTAPVVTLIGNVTETVLRWTAYTDAGITISDNFYSIGQLTIDTIGTWVNSSVEDAYYLQYRVTDPSGNIGFSEKRYIDVRGTNNVGEITGESIRVYPNPSTGNVTLEFSSTNDIDVIYTISDMAGRVVSNGKLEKGFSQYNIDLSAHSTGIYQVTVSDGSAHQVIKMTLLK